MCACKATRSRAGGGSRLQRRATVELRPSAPTSVCETKTDPRSVSIFQSRPGAVIPELAAFLGPSDTTKGMATLTKLAGRVAVESGATLSGGAEKTLSFGTQFALHFGVKDGKIVLTNSAGGISQVGSPSESLSDSADFKEAVDAAGLPDSNGGFLYFDLENPIPLTEGFA